MLACCLFMHELKEMGVFALDKDIETYFFNWIILQFKYLNNDLNKTDADNFITDIYETLSNTIKYDLK